MPGSVPGWLSAVLASVTWLSVCRRVLSLTLESLLLLSDRALVFKRDYHILADNPLETGVPLLAFSLYELLPDSQLQTTNVIPKLNLLNRLRI